MLSEEFHAAQQSKEFPDPVKPKVIDTQMLTELDAVCVVCDTFTRRSFPHCERWTAGDLARPVIAKKLCAADVVPRLPDDVIKEYDCSDFDPSLKGMLLSRSPLGRHVTPVMVEASDSLLLCMSADLAPTTSVVRVSIRLRILSRTTTRSVFCPRSFVMRVGVSSP
jgi:hypothetical protein